MGYVYDFSEMVSELRELNGTADELLSEIKSHEEAAELRHGELLSGISILTVILVISIAVKVMFK